MLCLLCCSVLVVLICFVRFCLLCDVQVAWCCCVCDFGFGKCLLLVLWFVGFGIPTGGWFDFMSGCRY